jgi:hypothetical protein
MNRCDGTPRISRSDLMGFLTTMIWSGGFGGFLDLFGKRSPSLSRIHNVHIYLIIYLFLKSGRLDFIRVYFIVQ